VKILSKAQSPVSHQAIDESNAETEDSAWKSLYKVSASAALIMVVVFFPIQIIAFSMAPIPTTAVDWFTLLRNNRLLGLLDLDLLYVADQALLIPIFLTLYVALRRANKAYMALATIFGILGATVYFATNNAVSMLYLSDQYAVATTDAQRSLFLAAGETTIAVSLGTAWYVFNVLASVALLIVSVVMLRSTVFSKATAYVGILGSIFGLAFFVPTAGIFFLLISAFALQIWFVLIAQRLFQIGQTVSNQEAKRN
jgi:hypothetical protein